MRRLMLSACLLGSLVVSSTGAQARSIEDFESYLTPVTTLDWLFFTDTNGDIATAATVGVPAVGQQSAYFILNSGNYASGDSVYFESRSIPPVPDNIHLLYAPPAFSAALAFAPYAGNTVPLSAVSYYFYTNDFDTLYSASVTPLPGSPTSLQTYPSVDLAGGTWEQYDWNGSAYVYNAPVLITDAILADSVGVGIQMDFNAAGTTLSGPNYMTIWVDNVPIPEPSALMLGCFGALGFLARRRRRTA